MTNIKEFNLLDVRRNSLIIRKLNEVYNLWGYEEISPSFINDIETIKTREVINQEELISLVSNKSLCLRPEMTTSIVKLISTRLINKKRPLRLWNNGVIFEKKQDHKNTIKLNEKIQSGIELIGYDTKFPEIEVLNILFDCIDKLNLKDKSELILLVSSTTIMELILKKYVNNNYENIKRCMINLDQDSLDKLNLSIEDKILLKDLIYTRGDPDSVINKLKSIYGSNTVLDDLSFLFEMIKPISNKYKIKIQLDPTFQPHLNLYAGIVFQLICMNKTDKFIVAKGGRYDELVKNFNHNEKIPTGLGFSFSIDNLRCLIKDDQYNCKKILLLINNKNLLSKALTEQKKLHKLGIVSILDLNPCLDLHKAEKLKEENNCSDIKWIS